jgi:hypothetical protein
VLCRHIYIISIPNDSITNIIGDQTYDKK